MMEIAISSIKSCKDCIEPRRNSLELYGYDFMVDDQYNTWLLEINSSPSMEFSTVINYNLKSSLFTINFNEACHYEIGENVLTRYSQNHSRTLYYCRQKV